MKGVRTYPEVDCESDHILLMGELQINFEKLKRGKN